MKILFNIKEFLLGHDFLVSLVSGILSSLVVSAVITILVYFGTDILKSPKLSLVVKQNGFYRDTILLSEDKNGRYVASFNFAIKNSGNKTFKAGEGYWNTYLDLATTTPDFKYFVQGEPRHQRDLIRYSVYPDSHTDISDFSYNLSVRKEDWENGGIPYVFQTDYGTFPKNIKIDPKTGAASSGEAGLIKLELPRRDGK